MPGDINSHRLRIRYLQHKECSHGQRGLRPSGWPSGAWIVAVTRQRIPDSMLGSAADKTTAPDYTGQVKLDDRRQFSAAPPQVEACSNASMQLRLGRTAAIRVNRAGRNEFKLSSPLHDDLDFRRVPLNLKSRSYSSIGRATDS